MTLVLLKLKGTSIYLSWPRRDFVARLAKDWAIPFGTRLVAPSIWPATRLTRGI